MGEFLLLVLAVAAFSVIFFNDAIALKCYQQPTMDEEALIKAWESHDLKNVRKVKQEAANRTTETVCEEIEDACLLATNCTTRSMTLQGVEMFDHRLCIASSLMAHICTNATAEFDGISGNEACKGGCSLCHTDLCNDKVEGDETTTANNEENNNSTTNGNNNTSTEGCECNGSRIKSPAIPLLFIGTITLLVVITLFKMWMI